MKKITQENGAGVDIEHLVNTIVGVVIQKFINPLQGMFIGLTNPTEATVSALTFAPSADLNLNQP